MKEHHCHTGQHMLDVFKSVGGVRVTGDVVAIDKSDDFQVSLKSSDVTINADHVVNAAGPYINDIAEMLGTTLPVRNTLQQKIAFEDTEAVIPRDMPFSIDLDEQLIDWNDEARELFANYPEIVLRGAARLNPRLKTYYDSLPSKMHHYGGYYTLTDENWPLIGKMDIEGAYVVGAMSGFGTMAACASGDLCARWILGEELPEFAEALSPQRYSNETLMTELLAMSSRGIL